MCTCLFFVISCQARIITVNNDGPADFNNIHVAIEDLNYHDIIDFQPVTYSENAYFYGNIVKLTNANSEVPNIITSTSSKIFLDIVS